ncbi:MAG TPA: AAA family ATPase [Patescibacteria group bacterium]|nr:AAA family ATPase [Patescibacteria group bacterium]
MDDSIEWNYHSVRAQKARVSVRLRGTPIRLLRVLAWMLLVFGVALLVLGVAFGWLVLTLAVLPWMVIKWYFGELHHLKSGPGNSVDSLLSGDILGQLPARPTPQDIASAVGSVVSGQFMGVRFGLTPSLLSHIASSEPSDTARVWQEAEHVRSAAHVPHYSGSVMAVALVRSFHDYQHLIAQIHLDDDDLLAGVRWQQHIRDLVTSFSRKKRTGGIARDWAFGYIPLLSRFGQNISQQIQGGDVLAVDVGSHVEAVAQLTQTFGARGRQNAALVGQAGAGKTTIIHAFAQQLLDGDSSVPDSLKFRQVFILDSSALIAAAPGRGELENLIMRILSEAYSAKNIILCLDNAQLFFEEGIGSVNLSNVLQPIIEAGNLRMILSMDEQRYLQIADKNPALINALNRISVTPATQAESMLVMQEKLLQFEPQRSVLYTYQALKEAFRLSERYLHDLGQPGRAIKLLESSANYHESGLVTMNSVQTAIEKTMDVKVSVASDQNDRERLLNLEQLIHERMINQKRAVQVVSDALRRARTGVRNENRPIGTFLFLGPTGVGKTELSKALADVYFGGEGKLIRLDLNEFVRPDDVSRLIADGVRNSGSLTAQVMKQPFSVVLLDEIEKAAPEVLATLLQMLDEGILRDEKNREVSFRDAIIVATSNAGADRIREYIDRGYDVTQFEAQFTDELISSGQFRPEFLNRFDEIVVFTPLTKQDLLKVIDLMIQGVNKTLAPQHITVEVDDDAKLLLVDAGYDPRLGARPMRRVVQKTVENTIAKAMLAGILESGGKLVLRREHIEQSLASRPTQNQ